jgi:hypothetical protein
MRKLLTILLLLLAVVAQGQMIIRANPHARAQVVSAPTEMITNGAFADGTGWTPAAVWTISGGVATFDDTNNGGLVQAAEDMVSNVVAGDAYTFECDITTASTNAYFAVFNAALTVGYIGYNTYSTGHITVNFTAPADVEGGGFQIYANDGGETFTITNISLKLQ